MNTKLRSNHGFSLARASAGALFAAGLGLAGCAIEPGSGEFMEGDADSLRETEGNLVVDSDKLWMPTGNAHFTKIKMCWSSGGDAAGRKAVQDAIKATWDDNSWVDVSWATVCSAGMVPVTVVDEAAAPAGDPNGVKFNFTFVNWSPSCQGTGTPAEKEAKRISCIKTIAVHEFGHILAFPHEQNRTNRAGITCNNGTTIAHEGDNWSILADWDATPIDTASIMSYCPEGTWTGMLTASDIDGVRAVYGGESNGIQHDSKVAIRQADKSYWQGNGFSGPDFKPIRVRRVPSSAGSLRFGDQIRLDAGGKFLCAKAGTASTIEWTTTYAQTKCSWTINQADTGTPGGNTVDVNDPLAVGLVLTAQQNGGTAFSANYGTIRFLRVN